MSAWALLCTILAIAPPPAEAPAELVWEDELPTLPETERDEARGRELYYQGYDALEAGELDTALRTFAEAYWYAGEDNNLLHMLGLAHRRAYKASGERRHLDMAILRFRQHMNLDRDDQYAADSQRFFVELSAEAVNLDTQKLAEKFTRLVVATNVDGATIHVDGGAAIASSTPIDVTPGEHHLEIEAPGYAAVSRVVEVPEGETMSFDIALHEIPGRVWVTGRDGSFVYLDGARIGLLPLEQPLEISPGRRSISVAKSGRVPRSQAFEIGRDEELSFHFEQPVSTQSLLAYSLFGVSGLGLITAGVLTGVTLSAQSLATKIDEERADGQISASRYQTRVDAVERRDQARIGLIATTVTGGASLIVGAVLVGLDRADKFETRVTSGNTSWRASPVLSPTMVGLGADLSF